MSVLTQLVTYIVRPKKGFQFCHGKNTSKIFDPSSYNLFEIAIDGKENIQITVSLQKLGAEIP